MAASRARNFTAFARDRLIGRGDLPAIVQAAHAYRDMTLSVFEDVTGRPVDLDLRGSAEEAVARLAPDPKPAPEPAPKPSRGRPRLGVVAREVTLLPRHWDWLASQPGGASAALRRLVDEARRHDAGPDARRRTQEAAYRVMTALAGDRPGYEEATRALFANDLDRFNQLTAAWPPDVGAYIRELNATVTPSP